MKRLICCVLGHKPGTWLVSPVMFLLCMRYWGCPRCGRALGGKR